MKRITIWLILAAPLLAQVRFEDIKKGPGDNWLTYSGDYGAQRHSPLDQIHSGNVANLTTKWVYHVDNARRRLLAMGLDRPLIRGRRRLRPVPRVHRFPLRPRIGPEERFSFLAWP